jgi:hypothetical protein
LRSENDSNPKPRFLVFCRNYIVADFRKSFDPVSDRFDFAYLTDSASPIAADTRSQFYKALDAGLRSEELDTDDVVEIVDRCRLLRNIERAQAEKLVHAMAIALAHHIDAFRPDALISQMVDEYVSHTFAILAKKRGLGYLGYCAGYFPGTSLLLADAHGRPYNWRATNENEISERLERVSGVTFRQTYNLGAGYSWGQHLKSMLRYRVKLLWFALRGRVENDPWNLHYRVTPFIAERRHLRDFPSSGLFSENWQADIDALRRQRTGAKIIYMPLSYFPESTIDYWVLDKRMIDYAAMIQRIAATLSRDHIVVVKEHLHMMGARDTNLLKALNGMDGVVSVPPLELSNAVVAEADTVLLGSGSPGIEATIRGKPVVTFCDTSYWYEPSGATFLDPAKIDEWPTRIEGAIDTYSPLDAEGQRRFIAGCLEASTRVIDSKTIWPVLDAGDVVPLLTRLATADAR